MNLHRRHKANKRVRVTKARTNRPEVILNGVFRVDSGMKVIHVELTSNNQYTRRGLARFCKAHGIHLKFTYDGWADATGAEEDLLLIDTLRFWANPLVKDWRWMDGSHVAGGSGAGAVPKRAPEKIEVMTKDGPVRIVKPRMLPTEFKGVLALREVAEQNAAHTDEKSPTPHKHGDETLDKAHEQIQARKASEQKDFEASIGLSPKCPIWGPLPKSE